MGSCLWQMTPRVSRVSAKRPAHAPPSSPTKPPPKPSGTFIFPSLKTDLIYPGETMFVHTVYFWLKPDITAEEKREFIKRGSALTTLPSVKHGWMGVPADTD